jgi:hypothetical protein
MISDGLLGQKKLVALVPQLLPVFHRAAAMRLLISSALLIIDENLSVN